MLCVATPGVEVDIPTSLAGIQFTFTNGALTIQCTNFTGDVVLSKPGASISRVCSYSHSCSQVTSY